MGTKVLLDASILISQHFLKGHLGIALLIALRRTSSKLVLPEATLTEAKERALDEAEEKLADIAKASNQLQVLLGQRPGAGWPGRPAFGAAIDDHLRAIEDVLEHIPIDLSDVRGALKRIVKHIVPAKTKEEFRDALLWETALRLAKENKVYLVAQDSHFVQGGQLHPDLANEVRAAGADLLHFMKLPELLAAVGPEARSLDNAAVNNAVESSVQPLVAKAIADKDISLTKAVAIDLKAFATQNPNRMALSFEIQFEGFWLREGENGRVNVIAIGSSTLDPRTNELSEIELDKLTVHYGDGGHGSIVFARTGGISPPPMYRPFEFREPL